MPPSIIPIEMIGMRLPLLPSANRCSNAVLRTLFLPIIYLYNYINAMQCHAPYKR